MMKFIFQAALLLTVITVHLISPVAAGAAPGDFLFMWGAQQHLSDAAGVAVDLDGNVYVTEVSSVQVFNRAGKRIRKWGGYGSGDGQFSYPTGIAVHNGKVYVADTGNNRIQIFDGAGNFVAKWGEQRWTEHPPIGISIDQSGRVYLTEAGSYDAEWNTVSGTIRLFDTEGNFVRQVGRVGSGDGQYSEPSGAAVDASGNVYVADKGNRRILIFNASGTFLRAIADSLYHYFGIAVDANGRVYLSGGNPEDFSVRIYDNAGHQIRILRFSDRYNYEHYWIPSALAVDRTGNVYVVDAGDDGLRGFDSAGNLLGQWWTYGTGDRQFTWPAGLAFDKSGKLYQTDGFESGAGVTIDRVRLFDPDGRFLGKWLIQSPDFYNTTTGIAVADNGEVFVAENVEPYEPWCTVQVFDGSGNFLRKWKADFPVPDEFLDAVFCGITVDKNGKVLVTNSASSRVQIYDSTGNLLRVFGTAGTGNGQFLNPEAIATDASGNIFVVDSGNSRIQMFNASYNFVRTWGGAGTGNGLFSRPRGIAVDRFGNVFVADTGNNRIQVFDRFGKFLLKWGSAGDEDGLFRDPRGVAVNGSGSRVYVADSGNSRIQVFQGLAGLPVYYVSGTVRQGSKSGPALPGAAVTIAGKSTTTGSNGTFKVTGVQAGAHTLAFSKSGYATRTINGFAVNGNKNLLTYLAPAPRYYVSGTVRQGASTGPSLAGATVSIAGKTATTARNGSFTITGLLAGAYTVTISKNGYITRTITGFVVNGNKNLRTYLRAR